MTSLINARYLLGEHPLKAEIAELLALVPSDTYPDAQAQLLVLIASAKDGIPSTLVDEWPQFREKYIPTLVLILDFESGEVDFEDMCAIVGKMLEPVVAPFLVLHAENGDPTALINLENLKVINYSDKKVVEQDSDPEHHDLVKEFVVELNQSLQEGGWEQFVQGLIVPAIPFMFSNKLGLMEAKKFLDLIPSSS
ncbi:MAG: hypothetical protein F2658_00440 [Actinobacteria bacterium]|jgi:hypothetical protein|uniref:Unannotated protein n=1 Tax=freshwater metagenome TaxID=449393 RepID=A0A6J6MSW1_9ZZZZ|nr:hypothetical protein [Actinomycetota bacterium]